VVCILLYAAVLLFWLRVYDSVIVVRLPCAVAGPGVCSCVLACCVRLVFQLLGGFLGLVFPSLRGVAGCFSVVLAVPVWRTFLYFCFGRELLCVSHNLDENKILLFKKNVKAYCSYAC
jgi:hypothetical protein